MITRADLEAEAIRWIDTPGHRQASLRGVGCDCKGLIVGVARELGMPEASSLHARMIDYGPVIDEARLRAGLEATLIQAAEPDIGDVMLCIIGGKAQHLAFFVSGGRMIHCFDTPPHRVRRVPIGRSRAIDSFWTWPSLGGL